MATDRKAVNTIITVVPKADLAADLRVVVLITVALKADPAADLKVAITAVVLKADPVAADLRAEAMAIVHREASAAVSIRTRMMMIVRIMAHVLRAADLRKPVYQVFRKSFAKLLHRIDLLISRLVTLLTKAIKETIKKNLIRVLKILLSIPRTSIARLSNRRRLCLEKAWTHLMTKRYLRLFTRILSRVEVVDVTTAANSSVRLLLL
jgi:hypothetical protein